MKKVYIISLIFIVAGTLALVGSAVGLYMWASKDLPGFKQITDYQPALVTTVYTRNDEVLGHLYREKRFLVGLDQLPDYLPAAFLAAEDAGFYQHEGVDFAAIARAVLANLKAGGIKQGASTITQQVIKALLLTPERSYERKLKEAILAYRLERYLTKDEILTIYLNHIYLGASAYGVEAAAREYFGKHASELSLAEAAMLAGLPQRPSAYDPYKHFDAAKNRQRYVLAQMRDLGWITSHQYEEAVRQPIILQAMEDPSWQVGAYYLEEVRRWLVERFGEEMVYEGGLHVRTAVDLKHQAAAEEAVRKGLIASTRRRGWQGPVANLPETDWKAYLAAQAEADAAHDRTKPIVHTVDTGEVDPVAALAEKIETEAPETAPEPPFAEGEWVEALVVEVSKDKAILRHGAIEGIMDVETVHWARELDPSKATEEVPAVKDCRKVVSVGDVIWVETVHVPDEEDPAWRFALQQQPKVEGALVSMDVETGEVLALVGGYSFARSQFNRATQAKRQPGSAFKPIVYSAAIDQGLTPASIIMDAPIVYNDWEHERVWRPSNFEGVFYGPTLLRTALTKSRNLVTIRVAEQIGIKTVIERAKAMGLETEFPENLSVALGSAEVSPLNLCQAYTTFPRGGNWIPHQIVLSVSSAWGDPLHQSEVLPQEAITPQTAYIMTKLMQEVVKDGTGFRARALKRPVAGKTGTTNDERDAWFMGFTPYLMTTVYVGFDENEPMGKYETGSRAASPIWVDYRLAVEDGYPKQDFRQPPGIEMVRVDADNGLIAGASTEESYFLPFKDGTQPSQVSQAGVYVGGDSGSGSGAGQDLLKQIF
jgi:penicillin-binding protein 1A